MLKKILAMFVFLAMFSGFTHAQAQDNVTVDVSVALIAEITVTPTVLNWQLVTPGQAAGQRNLTVENTGSANISLMYAHLNTLDVEAVTPYGGFSPAGYSAGGLIVMNNESNPEVNFPFLGRIEWNQTERIPNLILATNIENETSSGFFRNSSNEFAWVVQGNETTRRCNETGALFAIDDDVDLGTTDTRTPTTTDINFQYSTGDWGIFIINRSGSPLENMCVAVNYSCDKIYIYKYDKRSDTGADFGQCMHARYIRDAQMVPGLKEQLTVDAYVPKGIPAGNLSQTVLSITVS